MPYGSKGGSENAWLQRASAGPRGCGRQQLGDTAWTGAGRRASGLWDCLDQSENRHRQPCACVSDAVCLAGNEDVALPSTVAYCKRASKIRLCPQKMQKHETETEIVR